MLPRKLRVLLRYRYLLLVPLVLVPSLMYISLGSIRLIDPLETPGGFVRRPLDSVNTRRNVLTIPSHPARANVTLAPAHIEVKNKTKDVNVTHGCDAWFEEKFEDNLKIIDKYPRGDADKYLDKITARVTSQKVMSFPVIVTAANSGFYRVSQGLLKSIHQILLPKYKDIKIIYYDMGLDEHQRTQLTKHCLCEVRTFPFEDFPEHVRRLKTYAWKPLIVKTLLTEYNWVWWMDSSVRFVTSDLDISLQYSVDNSVLFFTYGVVFAVAQHTDIQTMDYLKEDRCKFRHFGEIEATFVLFHSDLVTNILVDQWASCALNEMCMAPPGTSGKLGCNVGNKSDGRCHRFDQAVLSILLRRLYHDTNDYPLVDKKLHIHDIRRGNSVNYFPP